MNKEKPQLSVGVVAAVLLTTLAPSLAGEWCENFEAGAGWFWSQQEYQGGLWFHTTYTEETAEGHDVPKPPSGEDGMLLLRPYQSSIVAWSMLVSPELTFLADASIQLDYWLWFNISQPHTPVSFMLFRPPSVRVLRPYIVGGSEDPTLAPLKVLHKRI
ncbi:hypothetical protein FJT64_003525 [Amphibalanus amphitrite]|uniref:Uncharacterized protein n=1 Tax=Amphibalanus amphitrite TaxID=1232801 RepID=A0A6A4W697_AMPAM|nr:hypothetical protein FJT64_003525 [Amphibalanus amphitrite]